MIDITVLKKAFKSQFGLDVPSQACFIQRKGNLSVVCDGQDITVSYEAEKDAVRGAFLACAMGEAPYSVEEKTEFKDVCLMTDCSRNGVLNPSEAKRMILAAAMLGYNSFMLYTEDTYEVDGEPEFGYLRGRYTKEELKELDSYAQSVGIELIPCIQTLAHFHGMKRWYKAHANLFDIDDILLCGEPRVYQLIENIFKTLAECFTTRRVHIGMDEAAMIGRGAYLTKNGYRRPFDILTEHLSKVAEIAEKYGFSAIMWSDMFFKIAYAENSCHDEEGNTLIPPDVIEKLPKNVTVCHWDYRDKAEDGYDENFRIHRCFKTPVWYAGSSFKCNSFFPSNTYSLRGISLGLSQAKKYGMNSVINTLWGDNGAECSVWSSLPCVVYFSYLARNKSMDEVKAHFKVLAGVDFDTFMQLEYPNTLMGKETRDPASPASNFLYNDLFSGQFDCYVTKEYTDTFKKCAKIFKTMDGGKFSYVVQTAQRLCEVLSIKSDMGIRLRKAYQGKDTETLQKIVREMQTLVRKIDALLDAVRTQWMRENKPNGLEVQEYRLGGLRERVKGCRAVLQAYLKGDRESIPELEIELLNDVLASCSPYRIFYNSFILSATSNVM